MLFHNPIQTRLSSLNARARATIRLISSSRTVGSIVSHAASCEMMAEAEDALQESDVRAFTNLDSFRGEARLGTWLARNVINEALTCLRRRWPAMDIDHLLPESPL